MVIPQQLIQITNIPNCGMILRFFKRNKPSTSNDGTDWGALKDKLSAIVFNQTEHGSIAFSDSNEKAKQDSANSMLVVLETLFSAPESYRSTKLLNSLAQGYDHYCVWFARGDSRKVYFEKSILLLTESIKKDPNQTYARAQLGALLIDQKLVRNLEKGIGLLNELKESGKLPDHLNSTLSKAQRQTGDLKANQEFDLCVYTDPSPAVFSEERKRFRALIRTYVKNNESENLIRCLNEYYNLAILVYACYGDFDCSSGTIGWKYDAAVEIVKSVCQEIDFDYRTTGKLIGANYISARDWGTFKKHFGDVGMEANLSTMVSKLSSNYSQYKDPF